MEQNKIMTALTEEDLENVTGGGAARNSLDYTSSNLTTPSQNVQSAQSAAGIKVLDTTLQKCLDQEAYIG